MRIGISQFNPCVGDLDNNYKKIVEQIHIAVEKHLQVIIFPELVLTGYPPEDLLLRPRFMSKVKGLINDLASANYNLNIFLGYPHLDSGKLYNRLAVISASGISEIYDKKELPNYGVFDEKRYFTSGDKTIVADINNIKFGLSVCEDLWETEHADCLKQAEADLIVSINASPFYSGIDQDRISLLKQRIKQTGLPVIYTNMVGGQDEVVFDGGSMVLDARGEVCFQAPHFVENLYVIDLDKDGDSINITHEGSDSPNQDIKALTYHALCSGVRDYINKNGFKGAVIGLSGGIDSALTLAIAVEAIGANNVEVILMPSRYTSDMSNDDALKMAQILDVKHHIIPIEKPFDAFTEVLQPVFENMPVDVTEENIQARCRGVLLMAISNKTGKIVLTTGNKSEMAVGYATLYGDMAGGFAPLKDVSKQLVYELSEWVNRDKEVIPRRIIDRPPTAELRHDQKDEDSLPPYDILDDILERYIEQDQDPQAIIETGHKPEHVNDVVRLVDRNEYKRRQAAPGVKITKRAFGKDRRYPITSGYREYD
jgi:NAD+ synthase (glutamine-hydrolysing)